MATESLKTIKQQLISCVQGQVGDLSKVDTHELGEAIDMIKDLSEAIYYCTITDSMEKADSKEEKVINNMNYYTTPYVNNDNPYRNLEQSSGYMYYTSPGTTSSSSGGAQGASRGTNNSTSYYTDMMRDPREGRAAVRRRMYMEGKEQHKDTTSQLRELEAYLQELSTDITEMIKDASPEERATLHQKMSTLADKIM